jgi:serine protease inhibitor
LDQEDYPLLGNFTSNIERYYHGTAKNVDFRGATEDNKKDYQFLGRRRELTRR